MSTPLTVEHCLGVLTHCISSGDSEIELFGDMLCNEIRGWLLLLEVNSVIEQVGDKLFRETWKELEVLQEPEYFLCTLNSWLHLS